MPLWARHFSLLWVTSALRCQLIMAVDFPIFALGKEFLRINFDFFHFVIVRPLFRVFSSTFDGRFTIH